MRLLKILLVWMIVLAIPAQGMAAAVMQFCGPSHHRMQAAAMAHDKGAEHQHAGSGNVAMADHADHAAQADLSAKVAKSFGKLTDPAQFKCSACGSCCTAAAIFNEFSVLPAAGVVSTYEPSAMVATLAYITDGPERPPRPFLA